MDMKKLVAILGAALFLSLSGNLFMTGLMLGQSYHHRGDEGGGPDQRGGSEKNRADWQKRDEQLRKELSESDRKILKEGMQGKRDQFKAMRQELDTARQKVEEAESTEPFDQSALDAAVKEEQQKKQMLLQTMRQTRDDVAKQMSPEGREVLKKLGPFGRGGDRGGFRRQGGDNDGPRRGGDGSRWRDGGRPMMGPPDGGNGENGGGPFRGTLGSPSPGSPAPSPPAQPDSPPQGADGPF